jgi:putative ABC transport system ATP-binding protein
LWYYAQNKKRMGPFELERLRDMLKSGQLKPSDMIWQEGTQKWVPASSVPELNDPRSWSLPSLTLHPSSPSALLKATQFSLPEIHFGDLPAPRRAGPPPQSAIVCKGITKSFGEGSAKTQVLRGIDLHVYKGQMTFLVGQTGCGKTTLISIMAGTLDPTKGSVTVFDQEITRMSQKQVIRFRGDNIGFIFQSFNLLPALTAAENAMVPLLIAGRDRKKAHKRACEFLSKIGMEKHLNHLPRMMSGGQQQRVAIARALVRDPRLLVCDEPTSALDSATGHTVMELLRDVAVKADRAVIVVTHDTRVFDFADRIVEMEDGKIKSIEEKVKAAPSAGDLPRPSMWEMDI